MCNHVDFPNNGNYDRIDRSDEEVVSATVDYSILNNKCTATVEGAGDITSLGLYNWDQFDGMPCAGDGASISCAPHFCWCSSVFSESLCCASKAADKVRYGMECWLWAMLWVISYILCLGDDREMYN